VTGNLSEQAQYILLDNAKILDVEAGEYAEGKRVLVCGDHILEVGGKDVSAPEGARVIDVGGRTLLPGLTDGHVHVTAVTADLAAQAEWSQTYVVARTVGVMRGMLHRGFTTVRDMGGADYGLAAAVDEGFLEGPRVLFGGKAISQTGGHADMRPRGRVALVEQHRCCPNIGVVCDGADQVRLGAREQLRTGANHIKIMLSGGVASPTDRVDSTQLSIEEIRAAVEEAEAANRYVAGHAYTARAVNRGLANGVRSIEHGNLLDESSIELFRKHEAFYVPTLVTYCALAQYGREEGVPQEALDKLPPVREGGMHALELCHRAGVPIAYGSDLLAEMHREQSMEFTIRSEVQPAADVLRSATTVGARLLQREGQLGVVTEGALADLLVVDANPLTDVKVLSDPERHLLMIMKDGRVVRDRLAA